MTPRTEGSDADSDVALKKKRKRKINGRKLLSFANDDDEDQQEQTKLDQKESILENPTSEDVSDSTQLNLKHKHKLKLKTNPNTGLPTPKAMTKATLAAEAAERDRLQAEFVRVQEQVRDSEIAIPFVFYDGSNLPGGTVKVKKGEQVWLFLERCRKLGAEKGVSSEGSVEGGGTKQRVDGKKSWARIGVDDLMLIRGDIIIPHHYEFYYFIANKVADPSQPERLLFDYTGTASFKDSKAEHTLLRVPKNEKVEGQDDDPVFTKVVDRRWYDKNKHIYPASLWREFKTGKDYDELKKGRRDGQGNAFFFS